MPSIKFSKHRCMACCFSGGWLLTMLFLRSEKYCGSRSKTEGERRQVNVLQGRQCLLQFNIYCTVQTLASSGPSTSGSTCLSVHSPSAGAVSMCYQTWLRTPFQGNRKALWQLDLECRSQVLWCLRDNFPFKGFFSLLKGECSFILPINCHLWIVFIKTGSHVA